MGVTKMEYEKDIFSKAIDRYTKKSSTHFKRDIKGRVIKTTRTGADTSIPTRTKSNTKSLVNKAERLMKQEKEQARLQRQKKINRAKRGLKRLNSNIKNANDWFLGR